MEAENKPEPDAAEEGETPPATQPAESPQGSSAESVPTAGHRSGDEQASGEAAPEPPDDAPDLGIGDFTAEQAARADEDAEKQKVYQVNNHFYAGVDAAGGSFGVQDGGERRMGGQRTRTGRLRAEDIEAAVELYAEPPCFADAAAKLERDRVVVVEGRPGIGRRAGAINLLHRVTNRQLVVLSPLNTLRELSERKYARGQGYLVLDRVRDRASADLEFTWANVKEQVRASRAYLVITNGFVGAATSAVPHVMWECPPPEDVLRAQLAGRADLDDVIQEVLGALRDKASLTSLVTISRMMRDEGLTASQALQKLDESAKRQVLDWFAEKPNHREVTAAAALCFLEGTDVRTYESLLERLHEVMASQVSGKRAKAEIRRRDTEIFRERETRLNGTGLLDVRDVPMAGGTTQRVVFKDESYRRYVLAELWRTRTNSFWDAIQEWLSESVEAGGDSTAIASGLAWLACSSATEVSRSYLEPWSAGTIGWPGQVTATYVLWFMCHRDGMEAVALQTAVQWARDENLDRKWTAALAFGGELGMYFPVDAVNRLWQLTSQRTDLWVVGCSAMANLFATFSDDEHGDANVVLSLLDKKMTDFGTGAGPRSDRGPMPAAQLMRLRTLTMSAALSVVLAPSFRTGRPAIAQYLDANPDRMAMIARIWAGLLIFRPMRWEAFYALRRALHALRDISKDPTATARAFGAALADALPPHERDGFKDAFIRVDEQVRKGRKEPLADVLVACLEAIAIKIHHGGAR